MAGADTERTRVIRYWRAIELFSPQNVPDLDPHDHVYGISDDGPLPWQPGHPLRRVALRKDQIWQHTVYGGLFSLQRVQDLLQDAFGPDKEDFDKRPPGTSALFAVTVTDRGRPLLASAEFASCAWATGRLLCPGPRDAQWLDGFEAADRACGREFRTLAGASADDTRADELRAAGHEVGRPVDVSALTDLITLIAEDFRVTFALAPAGMRVRSRAVQHRCEFRADGTDFLNSFFASDLARVADAVRDRDYGAALGAYLHGPARDTVRIDLRERPHVVDRHVAPVHTPAGRWPARTTQPLALSQQFAVNTVLRELAGPGIFAVNGPPGTGKTTMLRELIAALVVERARRLAEFARPEDAFRGTYHWKTDRPVSAWDTRLTGFEIVVASSNNGAVENISKEIPGRDAIDSDEWLAEASYYPELATAVLNTDNKGPQVAAWGLIAGRLGKKSNRQKFARTFWFGQAESGIAGFKDILSGYERVPADWQGARAAFRTAMREVDQLRTERSAVQQRSAEIPAVRAEIGREEADQAASRVLFDQLTSALESAASGLASLAHVAAVSALAKQTHQQARQGLFATRLGLSRQARDWRRQHRALAARADATQDRVREAAAHRTDLTQARRQAQAAERQHQARLEALMTRLEELHQELADAAARWGEAVPVPGRDARTRELSGPWTDPQWNAARSRVFLAALRLQQAFVAAEPTRMRQNLDAALDIVGGNVPGGVTDEAVLAAWQSLFFVVPVFSTTFASFARVFSQLERESLGWLFIDEAGQVAPQAAVGAIWRSQRAVVVGDPKQLEPVVSIPLTAQQALRDHAGLDEWWLTDRSSAQRLADEANSYGTYLTGGDHGRGPARSSWVGAPLRVHRRCEQPMFDVSNAIAYGGLMVYGTNSGREPLAAPPSAWLHIQAAESQGHWIPAEGAQARRVLIALHSRYDIEPTQIFVLSPFRDVASCIERLIRDFPGVRGGTVHTAQGREADVVVLILGGDPAKPGAKRWASTRPNLLNVAVSRARRRLYVIGDRTAWSDYSHFDVLCRNLSQ